MDPNFSQRIVDVERGLNIDTHVPDGLQMQTGSGGMMGEERESEGSIIMY